MKIPILWRIERWVNSRKEKTEEVRSPKLWGKHKRQYGECPKCSYHKFAKRKNSQKCLMCGHKTYFSD